MAVLLNDVSSGTLPSNVFLMSFTINNRRTKTHETNKTYLYFL